MNTYTFVLPDWTRQDFTAATPEEAVAAADAALTLPDNFVAWVGPWRDNTITAYVS